MREPWGRVKIDIKRRLRPIHHGTSWPLGQLTIDRRPKSPRHKNNQVLCRQNALMIPDTLVLILTQYQLLEILIQWKILKWTGWITLFIGLFTMRISWYWKSHWKVPPHWNTSETTLKSFTKDNHTEFSSIITLKYVTYKCYSRMLSPYNPTEKDCQRYSNTLFCQFSALLLVFRCHNYSYSDYTHFRFINSLLLLK